MLLWSTLDVQKTKDEASGQRNSPKPRKSGRLPISRRGIHEKGSPVHKRRVPKVDWSGSNLQLSACQFVGGSSSLRLSPPLSYVNWKFWRTSWSQNSSWNRLEAKDHTMYGRGTLLEEMTYIKGPPLSEARPWVDLSLALLYLFATRLPASFQLRRPRASPREHCTLGNERCPVDQIVLRDPIIEY